MMKSPEQRRRFGQVREQLIERHCVGCHTDFDLKPGMGNAQRDQAALRFILAQESWIFPGNPDGGRLYARVWGMGAEKIMPADGRTLLNDPAYRALLTTLDEFVRKLGK